MPQSPANLPPNPTTADLAVFLPPDAVDDAGQAVFERTPQGSFFYPAPEARVQDLPEPDPATAATIHRLLPEATFQHHVLHTRHAADIWHGRPADRSRGVRRIPGVPFAAFVLDGLLRRRPDLFAQILRNLARHTGRAVHELERWRRNTDYFVERYLPGFDDNPLPRSPIAPRTVGLSTRHKPLLQLAAAIARYDASLRRSTAITETVRKANGGNPYHAAHYHIVHRNLRSVLRTIQATRKVALPLPIGAPLPFTLLDPGDPPDIPEPTTRQSN